MLIYKITNKINGKRYIGQTKQTLELRFKGHVRNAKNKVNRYLYDAMNKYGYPNFFIEIIENNVINVDAREKFWIKELDTFFPNGYNMTCGGGGGFTLAKWSLIEREELYRKQGNSRRGPRSKNFKVLMSKVAKQREAKKTEEQKQKIAEKIRKTNIQKGIMPPKTIMFGKNNPNYIDILKPDLILMVKDGKTKKQIAEAYNTTGITIWNKIKQLFGDDYDFYRLRREFRNN